MTITLESIKSEQEKLREMIVSLEASLPRIITLASASIELRQGEHYAGVILDGGKVSHHLILLPDDVEKINWNDAMKLGELPTRREQSLLFANLKEKFKEAYYWSCEQHASTSDYAWLQYFANGYQYDGHKDDCYRARAVRRLVIL